MAYATQVAVVGGLAVVTVRTYTLTRTRTDRQTDLPHRDTQCQSDDDADADAAADAAAALRQYLPARATEMSLHKAGKIAHKMHLKKEHRIEFEALLQRERDDLCTSVCACCCCCCCDDDGAALSLTRWAVQ